MDWTNDKCLQMIEIYRNFRCLWDPTYENYKNTTLKQDAWEEVAILMHCNVEEVKKKMDSLLASYRRERQKWISGKSGDGADYTYTSKWFAFTSMHFLMDKYKPRKTLDTNRKRHMTESTLESQDEQNENEKTGEISFDDTTASHIAPTESQSSTSTQRSDTVMAQSLSKHTKRARTEDARVTEAYNILKNTYQSKLASQRDRSQAFGNHVASKHREYTQRTKALVEHHINNILFDADMGKYEYILPNTMPSYSYTSQNMPSSGVKTNVPLISEETEPEYSGSTHIVSNMVQPPPTEETELEYADSSQHVSNYITIEEELPNEETEPDYATSSQNEIHYILP